MATRRTSWVLALAGIIVLLASAASAQLSEKFYDKTCPGGVAAVRNVVVNAVGNDRRFAAGLLRLHFHDCWVRGCDGSVLLNSNPRGNAEKDAGPNRSLQGFSIIDQAKAAVERICPGVFSCADITALAAKDAVSFIGGPSWKVPLGRRDGTVSRASEANAQLPQTSMSFSQLAANFASKGLSENDLIFLSGAHTIGLTHCNTITPRLFNFRGSKDGADPYLNKSFVSEKRGVCPNTRAAANNFVNLDSSRGGQTFDTNYYQNVLSHKASFRSDDALISVTRGRNLVQAIASGSQSRFFSAFGSSMEKMGRIGVLTGRNGEIRRTCSKTN
ncbi:hypothetical protein R1sor_002313 [Riccia sorocarpa]|uniref:Peroxidase n=1 Tax=Riccia sorocarpa TaxID=122646 RepID=A0ABD3H047_9MARC